MADMLAKSGSHASPSDQIGCVLAPTINRGSRGALVVEGNVVGTVRRKAGADGVVVSPAMAVEFTVVGPDLVDVEVDAVARCLFVVFTTDFLTVPAEVLVVVLVVTLVMTLVGRFVVVCAASVGKPVTSWPNNKPTASETTENTLTRFVRSLTTGTSRLSFGSAEYVLKLRENLQANPDENST